MSIDAMASERKMAQALGGILRKREQPITKHTKQLTDEEIKELIQKEIPQQDLESIRRDLDKITSSSEILNKKVKLSINKEINRVIITVLDKETQQVIKQIPCKEIQNLAVHLREAIGILFDKTA